MSTLAKLWWLLKEMPKVKRELTDDVTSNGASIVVFGHFLSFNYDRVHKYTFSWIKVPKT